MAYVRNTWYVAGWSKDVSSERPVGIQILGEPIVLWRSNGQPLAFEDRCVHRLAALSLGRIEQGSLRCMYHGMLYDADGRVCEIPGQDIIPDRACVKRYPVAERHGWIWVWMGDPERADKSLIPEIIGLDNPDWILGGAHLDYESEACLINDNLLDLSHGPFVHAKSFNIGRFAADHPWKVNSVERGVHFENWTGAGLLGRPWETWMSCDFLLPGVFLQYFVRYPEGTAEKYNFQPPELSEALHISCASHGITPTGKGKARYFFQVGPNRKCGTEQERDGMVAVTLQGFAEDKVVIEAQQRVMDATPNPVCIPTSHDRGVTIFNRLVDSLCREESAAPR